MSVYNPLRFPMNRLRNSFEQKVTDIVGIDSYKHVVGHPCITSQSTAMLHVAVFKRHRTVRSGGSVLLVARLNIQGLDQMYICPLNCNINSAEPVLVTFTLLTTL